jgi:L-fucose isomerase-like protein
VVAVDLHAVEQTIRSVSHAAVASRAHFLLAQAADTEGAVRADLEDAVRVYLALKEVVAEHELDALTVRCFDLVLELETTGCFALAQLTDEAIIAGCEGDLVSTVGLLWAHELLGETPWMANPAPGGRDPQHALAGSLYRPAYDRGRLLSLFPFRVGTGFRDPGVATRRTGHAAAYRGTEHGSPVARGG